MMDMSLVWTLVFLCLGSITIFAGRQLNHSTLRARAHECSNWSRSRIEWSPIVLLLLHGSDGTILQGNLPPLSQDIEASLTRQAILRAWLPESRAGNSRGSQSVPWILATCFRRPLLAPIYPRLVTILCRYGQPVLITSAIRFADQKGSGMRDGSWLIAASVVAFIGPAISNVVYQHRIALSKLVLRSALTGMIHDKIMTSFSSPTTRAEAIALLSNDIDSLSGSVEMFHETWAQIAEVTIAVSLLARRVGWLWPLPLIFIYLSSHVSRYVASRLQPRQRAWNSSTSERIATTSSVIAQMKRVKMLGWQQTIIRRIDALRAIEIRMASRLRWVTVFYNASANAVSIFSPALTLALYATTARFRNSALDTETAFTTVAILGMVTHPANMIMTIVPRAIAARTNFQRIKSFLVSSPKEKYPANHSGVDRLISCNPAGNRTGSRICVQNLTVGRNPCILENINADIRWGSLTIIAGLTGSGKSALLRAVMGEVVPISGLIQSSVDKIGYCAQQSWLPTGTIKQVIYGLEDKATDWEKLDWYHTVIDMCCLTYDLELLPHRDNTPVGVGGSSLSGGQRQRIALARAVFAKCDLLILDDTFSSLDGKTEQTVFDNLLGRTGILRSLKTTVILGVSSGNFLHTADHIVVLEDGKVATRGEPSSVDTQALKSTKFRSDKTKEIKPSTTYRTEQTPSSNRQVLPPVSDKSGVLAYYLDSISASSLAYFVSSTTLYAAFITFQQYWLQLWTEPTNGAHRSIVFYVAGYLIMSAIAWTSTSTQMWSVLIRLAPGSSLHLHSRLLRATINAQMPHLAKIDSGRISTAFTHDLRVIDKELPAALQTLLTQICKLTMQVLLLCTTQVWLVAAMLMYISSVLIVQKFCLRTTKQLRSSEAYARARLLANVEEHIEGIETIRAFRWTGAAIQSHVKAMDEVLRPESAILNIQRCFNCVLDLLAGSIAIACIATAAVSPGEIRGAQIGIALNVMLVANSTLLKLCDSWVNLETSLSAVGRLKELNEALRQEYQGSEDLQINTCWPSKGTVQLRNVYALYNREITALTKFSIEVEAGTKVVVCGRTGSGKSSFLATLLRLLEPTSGEITLDGIDLQAVPLDLLRKNAFIAIPQDPFILSTETLRFNLGPDGQQPDVALAAALSKTGLWHHFFAAAESSPLDRKIVELKELSAGQKQLLAITRAIIKAQALREKGVKAVVLLDEFTSSLDLVTEAKIFKIVEKEFRGNGHTVIVVTHRLGTLREYVEYSRDKIVVLSNGRIQSILNASPKALERLGQMGLP